MNVFDTIAAVSTPRGKGGVALLRISGPDAVEIATEVFLPRGRKFLRDCESRRAVYGTILRRDTCGDTEEIDDGVAVIFRAPASYTGEDTVEITCHGGVLVTREVLAAILAAGARAATAGEFTRRAFLNGKMSLSGAEALGSLLEAGTVDQLRLSHAGMHGRLEAAVRALYDRLLAVVSQVYAVIDYPDEDLATLSREEISERLSDVLSDVVALGATYKSGKAVAEGIATVICGKPNVGKSSLYNRLVGEDAAIVTDVAGTTRDVLEATVAFGRVTLRLCDTAGLHESGDKVESIGIGRAREKIAGAELLLAVFDGSRPRDGEDKALCALSASLGARTYALINKSDLGTADASLFAGFDRVIPLSALTGDGLDALRAAIEEDFFDGRIDLSRDAVVAEARQHAALLRAAEALRASLSAIRDGALEDVFCGEIEAAMSALSEVDGRQVSEDIVSAIFSKFCVGK